jgi:hypothetical protein
MYLNSNSDNLESDLRLSNYFRISCSALAGVGAVVARCIPKKSLVVGVSAIVKKNLAK